MTIPKDGIRKAALLVAALDSKAAMLVLGQMDPEQARMVRLEVKELGPADPQEQRRVIDEFFRIGPMVPEKEPPGIELDGRRKRNRIAQIASAAAAAAGEKPSKAENRPFVFLHETESEELARTLAPERPQTIAVVLSHLPSAQAGEVLARLAPDLQTEVVHRLFDLEETDPEILRELERCLRSRFSSTVPMQRRRVAGPSAVTGILDASNTQIGRSILENLAAANPSLAERIAPAQVDYDDLMGFDDASLRTVFESVDPELASLALTGEEEARTERVLGLLPQGRVELIRRQTAEPGPTRLSDVEQARQRIAAAAHQLLIEGRIAAPHGGRPTVAAAA